MAHVALAQAPAEPSAEPKAAAEPVKMKGVALTKTVVTEKGDDGKEKVIKKDAKFEFGGMKFNFSGTDDGKGGIKIKDGKDGEINVDLSQLKEIAEDARKHPQPWWTQLDDILVPLAFFAFLFSIFYMRHQNSLKTKAAQMEIIKTMVEKGQPIPPNLFTQAEERRTWKSDMDRGFKLAGVGAGLAIFFLGVGGPWAIGAMVGLMGVGYLASAYFKKRTNADAQD